MLQLSFTHPSKVKIAAAALQAGLVLGGRSLPTYETHTGYLLQFMTDYHLAGCDLLRATARLADAAVIQPSGVMFRYPLPEVEAGEAPGRQNGGGGAPHAAAAAAVAALNQTAEGAAGRAWLHGGGWNVLSADERLRRQTSCEVEADVRAADIANPTEVAHHAFTDAGAGVCVAVVLSACPLTGLSPRFGCSDRCNMLDTG
eukprot:COSAG01_NODE_162_length_23597_cov_21.924130_8_plen_201_part_00